MVNNLRCSTSRMVEVILQSLSSKDISSISKDLKNWEDFLGSIQEETKTSILEDCYPGGVKGFLNDIKYGLGPDDYQEQWRLFAKSLFANPKEVGKDGTIRDRIVGNTVARFTGAAFGMTVGSIKTAANGIRTIFNGNWKSTLKAFTPRQKKSDD